VRIGLIFLFFAFLSAHDFWILPGNFEVEKGDTVSFLLCGGHDFPKSTYVVEDRALGSVTVSSPGGKTFTVKMEKMEKARRGSFVAGKEGTYTIEFSLYRNPRRPPVYVGWSYVISGDMKGFEPPEGMKLAVIPDGEFHPPKAGETLHLKCLYCGEPLSTTLEVFDEKGGHRTITADRDGVALLKLRHPGTYMVKAWHDGLSSSFVFRVEKGK